MPAAETVLRHAMTTGPNGSADRPMDRAHGVCRLRGAVSAALIAVGTVLALPATTATGRAAAPQVDYPVFLDLNYRTAEAAARVWTPLDQTAPPQPFSSGGVPALRLRCNLAGTQMPRAAWDAAVSLDLRLSRGIRFQFRCANRAPVGHFSCYLRSGSGWYTIEITPRCDGQWETVEVLKAASRVEGKPDGWARVDRLRLAAWRGADADTQIEVAAFGVLPGTPDVVIARGLSVQRPDSKATAGEAARYAENVDRALARSGVQALFMEDLDLSPTILSGLRLVILPYNPSLPDSVTDVLLRFVERGGRVLGFYSTSARLIEAVGMEQGAFVRAADLPNGLARMVFTRGRLQGGPRTVAQNSGSLQVIRPVAGKSSECGRWQGRDGKDTGFAAVVGGDRGLWVSHVYLDDDPANGSQLLLAMVARFVPRAWELAATNAVVSIERIEPDQPAGSLPLALAQAGALDGLAQLGVSRSQRLKQEAEQLLLARRYEEAIAKAQEARAQVEDAYYRAQMPEPVEFRGVWCHRGYGIYDWTWDQSVRQLAACGFTAVFPNLRWAGRTFYPSQVLPTDAFVREQGDQLEACLAACRKYGVQLHVWAIHFSLGSGVDPDFVKSLRQAGRLQRSASGRAVTNWLCPSHPANQELEIKSMAEIVRDYDVDGVHLDHIRYPGSDHCFCEGCRRRFEASLGKSVTGWPAAVRRDGPLQEKWRDFRRAQITRVVQGIAEAVRQVRPGVKVSAAVFTNPVSARDDVGQDWPEWCRRRYLDFVCPMDYIPAAAAFESTVRRQLEAVASTRVAVYPGIGVSTAPLSAPEVIAQIAATRRLRTRGFVLFEYDLAEATTVLPCLAKGMTRPRPAP